MKLLRNSLLIALSLLLPTPASITLAQTTSAPTTIEKPASTDSPASTTKPTPETTNNQEVKSDSEDQEKEPELTPEEVARQQKLMQADQLYLGGQYAAAEKLYREAKPAFANAQEKIERKEAITDPEKLSPAGRVYWRQSQAGIKQRLESKIFVPLELLVQQYPEFIPGQISYAQALKDYNQDEKALVVLEKASSLYPEQPDLLKARITALGEKQQWLEASLAARQFALMNPNHQQASEFTALAEQNLERYKKHLRAELRGNAIANFLTGALGYALTGSLIGPLSAVETTALLLRGESNIGNGVAKQVKRQLPLVEDEETLNYVREIGNRLASVAGRNDFQYEFYVINDDKLNAFALPGGKIFINAGAIIHTNSEAELAGLLAHELSHSVLSHGFQLVTQGNVTANVTRLIPYGGIVGNLLVLDYSRDMERQADVVGTRLLVSTGYAADGLHNLMVTLNKQDRDRPIFSWLSSHPVTNERIRNLENLISTNGYNRYAYEGVSRHTIIKAKVKKLIEQQKKSKRRLETQEREPKD